jgi:hypothetical protein
MSQLNVAWRTSLGSHPKSTSLAPSTQLNFHLMLLDTSADRQRLSHPSRRIPVASPAHPCKLDPSGMGLKPASRRKASTPDRQCGHYVTCQCLAHGLCLQLIPFLLEPFILVVPCRSTNFASLQRITTISHLRLPHLARASTPFRCQLSNFEASQRLLTFPYPAPQAHRASRLQHWQADPAAWSGNASPLFALAIARVVAEKP